MQIDNLPVQPSFNIDISASLWSPRLLHHTPCETARQGKVETRGKLQEKAPKSSYIQHVARYRSICIRASIHAHLEFISLLRRLRLCVSSGQDWLGYLHLYFVTKLRLLVWVITLHSYYYLPVLQTTNGVNHNYRKS